MKETEMINDIRIAGLINTLVKHHLLTAKGMAESWVEVIDNTPIPTASSYHNVFIRKGLLTKDDFPDYWKDSKS